jgi:hypothetical protein
VIEKKKNLIDEVDAEAKKILQDKKNLIIIFEDRGDLNNFELNYNRDIYKGKNVLFFFEFEANFHKIQENLAKLNLDNFVVVTTKEGSRGVDYKGPSPAHVIICYSPNTYADCV